MVRKAGRVTEEDTEAGAFQNSHRGAHSVPAPHCQGKGTPFQQDRQDESPGVEMMLEQGRLGARKHPHETTAEEEKCRDS